MIKLEEVFDSWITDLISSILGGFLIYYGFYGDLEIYGRIICILFGLILQIPTVYFKIYQWIIENFQFN